MPRTRTFYVAGPMTGLENYNWPAFEETTAELRARGHQVVSPTEIDEELGYVDVVRSAETGQVFSVRTTELFDYEKVLAKDLEAVKGCTDIYLLPGWEGSKGANRELRQALKYGLAVTHHPDAVRYPDVEFDGEVHGVPNANAEHTSLPPEEQVYEDPPAWARWIAHPSTILPEPPSANPKDLVGDTKPQMHLVPPAGVAAVARVMELGAKKYGAYNWRDHPVRSTVYVSAALRHLAQYLDGETTDPESDQSHLAHVAACCLIILDATAGEHLVDDRPKPGPAANVIREV